MSATYLKQIYQHPLLSDEDLEAVYKAHKQIRYTKGDVILKKGQIANEYVIIEEGLIRSFVYDYEGKEITLNFFSEKDIVIEVSSLFQRIPTNENIHALTDCVCWQIDFAIFQNFFHTKKGFREWGRSWLATSLFQFKQRSIAAATQSSKERYLELLKDKPQIFLQAPLKYIASYLGITDTSLSRIRKETAKD